MALPRTFVGFSSTDIHYYRLMLAWKAQEDLDFDFYDCQLQGEINSDNERYIKDKCRDRIDMAGTFIQIIGTDTRYKNKYVAWEAEVALEKKCRIIGVNIDGWRRINDTTCPPGLKDVGATFVPFSPQIVAHALEHAQKQQAQNWEFRDETYRNLGYSLSGDTAVRPSRPFPFR
jgi:hypothetical protein